MNEPIHILVVDDEADLIELISYNLRKEGFIVDSASDGDTALSKIRKGNYDLLILDLMLPGIQGIELCRIVRNDLKYSRLPIIMLTAKGEEVDQQFSVNHLGEAITMWNGSRSLHFRK